MTYKNYFCSYQRFVFSIIIFFLNKFSLKIFVTPQYINVKNKFITVKFVSTRPGLDVYFTFWQVQFISVYTFYFTWYNIEHLTSIFLWYRLYYVCIYIYINLSIIYTSWLLWRYNEYSHKNINYFKFNIKYIFTMEKFI